MKRKLLAASATAAITTGGVMWTMRSELRPRPVPDVCHEEHLYLSSIASYMNNIVDPPQGWYLCGTKDVKDVYAPDGQWCMQRESDEAIVIEPGGDLRTVLGRRALTVPSTWVGYSSEAM